MQQQIQINRRPEQVLNDAAGFLTKRRAKVTDRTERGLRFGLQGSSGQDGGRVTVAPGAGGTCTVTVQADGLGVMAIAEGFIRELRKQARDQGRSAQRGQRADAGTMRGDFSGLRERLGMPPPERSPRPPQRPMPPSSPPEPVEPVKPVEPVEPVEAPESVAPPEPVEPAPASPHAAAAPAETAEGPTPTGGPTLTAAAETGTSGAVNAAPAAPQPVDVPSRSAEATGGVPAPEEAQTEMPSDTAKAHSGAGSPHVAPRLDPSVPPDRAPAG